MARGLITAVRTLTIFPVPGKDAEPLADALPWFPLIGFLLGSSLYWLARAFEYVTGGWTEGAAAVVVIGGAVLTRGFHLDGLADWADGFGGGRNRDHTLAIMKDSHVGAFGLAAVALALLLKYVALRRLGGTGILYWIAPVYLVSRLMMVELAVCLPYARPVEGTGGPFVSGARTSHRVAAFGLAAILLAAIGGTAGLMLMVIGFTACRLLGIWFFRRIGGITGDLLGASCEIIETGLLFYCAAAGIRLSPYIIKGFFGI